jgi:hypothetical protein
MMAEERGLTGQGCVGMSQEYMREDFLEEKVDDYILK